LIRLALLVSCPSKPSKGVHSESMITKYPVLNTKYRFLQLTLNTLILGCCTADADLLSLAVMVQLRPLAFAL
jgi:hypothetical protein